MKNLGFALAAVVLFFAGLEGILVLAGVDSGTSREDPYVGFAGHLPLFRASDEGAGILVTAANKRSYFNLQRFPRRKAEGTFRIFCVGGSTTFGRPADDATSFAGWLREMLPACDSSRPWEVINAGGISYASYRVASVMEELADYEPDLFIVYTGHNEFLERRTYSDLLDLPVAIRETSAALDRTRTYTVLRKLLRRDSAAPVRDILPAEVDALLDRSVGPDDYVRDDAERARILNHFRFNLERMVAIARRCGAGILLVTPAANLRDSAPFKSQATDGQTAADHLEWREAVGRAQAAQGSGRTDAAIASLQEAAARNPRHAETWFRLGTWLADSGRLDEARDAFRRAWIEDVCPLRALPEIVKAVREVADEAGAPLVDWAREAEAASPGGIPGRSLFVDHVHPTRDAHGKIAGGILDAMIASGFVTPGSEYNAKTHEEIAERIAGRVDPEFQARSLVNLARVVGWSGKIDEAYRHARDALALDPHLAEAHGLAAAYAYRLGRADEARSHADAALRGDPDQARAHDILGLLLLGDGRADEALAHHRRAVELAPESAETRNNYAFALMQVGQLEEARMQADAAVRIQPTFPEAHNNRGIANARSGRTEEALEDFREAVRLRPQYAQAHNNLGLALAGRGRFQEAAEEFEAALSADPAYAEAQRNLSAARQRLGR